MSAALGVQREGSGLAGGDFLTGWEARHKLFERARSSVVEQPAHNRLVAGSIPAGPTFHSPAGQIEFSFWSLLW